MYTKITFIFSITFVLLGFTSCFEREEFPVEPIISDPVFVFSGDSSKLTFSFTDGDGDIGLAQEDTIAPFNPDSYYHYNLYLDYYEKHDVDGWVKGTDLAGEPIVFRYRLKPIVVNTKSLGIKGTMDVNIINFNNPFSEDSDTIKYVIKLIDKALNESNTLETDEIYIN